VSISISYAYDSDFSFYALPMVGAGQMLDMFKVSLTVLSNAGIAERCIPSPNSQPWERARLDGKAGGRQGFITTRGYPGYNTLFTYSAMPELVFFSSEPTPLLDTSVQ